jgi:hypothetical protein
MARVFPWLVEPVAAVLPAGTREILLPGWVVVPMTEIAVALGLLAPRLRNAAVVAAIATHVVIFGLLGPLAHGTNAVIWPWNVAMAVLVALLLWNARGPSALDAIVPRRIGAHAAMLALFVALPVLSLLVAGIPISPASSTPGISRWARFPLPTGWPHGFPTSCAVTWSATGSAPTC